MEELAVHRVVDDVQLRLRQAESGRESRRAPCSSRRSRRAARGSRRDARSMCEQIPVVRREQGGEPRRPPPRASAAPRATPRARRRRRGRRRSRAGARATRRGSVASAARRDRPRARNPGRATARRRWNGSMIAGSISCRRVCGHDRVYREMATLRSSSASSARSGRARPRLRGGSPGERSRGASGARPGSTARRRRARSGGRAAASRDGGRSGTPGNLAGSRKRLDMTANDSKDRAATARNHGWPAPCSQGLLAGRTPPGGEFRVRG